MRSILESSVVILLDGGTHCNEFSCAPWGGSKILIPSSIAVVPNVPEAAIEVFLFIQILF
jgi:hypothetical protein